MSKWSKEEVKVLVEFLNEYTGRFPHMSASDALQNHGFDRSPEAVRGYVNRNEIDRDNLNGIVDVLGVTNNNNLVKASPDYSLLACEFANDTIDKIKKYRDTLVDRWTSKFCRVGRPKNANVKILSLSDFHIPFENDEVIKDALENHSDADILVLNGDIFDMYSVSSFSKNKQILIQWEYKVAMEWLKLLSDMFPKVVLVSGNHEARLARYFSNQIDPSLSFMYENDMLDKLANGYDINLLTNKLYKAYDFDNVHYTPGQLCWYTMIGKAIFVHPKNFSVVPMRTVIKTAESFLQREDFEAVIQGHSHKIGKLVWRDKLLIEQGCCCIPMEYESDGRNKYLPQSFGYAIVYVDADTGSVDFNKSDIIYLGTGSPVKEQQENILELI